QWQNFQSAHYAIGIEPSTNHVLGQKAARDRGEMIWLEHGEERSYDSRFRVLTNAAEIAASEARISGLAAQPAEDYPLPSGNFEPIRGRS
ncbi:MAG: DUF4432 family protein, partial [Hoeflea sp.]|nr:DUF4432 family protein [Hoeflea sp.]